MPDYEVPSEQPEYHVPADTQRDGCPRCGSLAIMPGIDTVMRVNNLPRQLQLSQCARCGTRYRARPSLPTWGDLGRDIVTFAIIIVAIVVIIGLFNLFFN